MQLVPKTDMIVDAQALLGRVSAPRRPFARYRAPRYPAGMWAPKDSPGFRWQVHVTARSALTVTNYYVSYDRTDAFQLWPTAAAINLKQRGIQGGG